MNVGQRIREHREAAGLLQDDLAKSCYVSRQTISNWERNRTLPDIESLKRIAGTFGTTVDALIGDDAPEIAQRVDDEARDFLLVNSLYTCGSFIEAGIILIRSDELDPLASDLLWWLYWFICGVTVLASALDTRIRRRHNFQTTAEINRYLIDHALSEDTWRTRAMRFLIEHDYISYTAGVLLVCSLGIALNEAYRNEIMVLTAFAIVFMVGGWFLRNRHKKKQQP